MVMFDNLFANSAEGRIPRGEIWISGELLKELGREASQESIINLVADLNADVCFLSYSSPVQHIPVNSGEMARLIKKARSFGLACGVAVDGPFERTVAEHGFFDVMSWFYDHAGLLAGELEKNSSRAKEEIVAADSAGADLVLLCDDIAYKQGLYFSPAHFKSLLLPLYRGLRESLATGKHMGFHSDGSVEAVIHSLSEEGYSLFSLEPEAMPLEGLCRTLPENAVILSGIRSDWLMGPEPADLKAEINRHIGPLAGGCRLILSSACGLSGITSLERLKKIYRLV